MPLAHQLILGVIVAGLITLPVLLFWAWIFTKGWEYGPLQGPQVQPSDQPKLDPGQGEDARKAA